MIEIPPRNSAAEAVSNGASRCLRSACERHFDMISIGDVATVVSGGTPNTQNPDYWNGSIVWITPRDLGRLRNIDIDRSERCITQAGLHSSSARLLPVGTVVLSSRAPIGHLGITSVPLATNQGFKNIIPSACLDSRYLFHMLRASVEELEREGRGNTFKEIPARVVKDFRIPFPPLTAQEAVAEFLEVLYRRLAGERLALPQLPSPLTEQRRIVARIEKLGAKVEEARGFRRQAVQEAAGFQDSAITSLFENGESKGWEKGILGDYVIDCRYGTSEKANPDGIGVPVIRMGNIQNGHLMLDDLKYVPLSDSSAQKLLLQEGDVLVNRTNSAELVGKCAVFEEDGDFVFASYIIRLRLDTARAEPRLVAMYINSPAGRSYMFSERKQMTGQANINSKKLKALPIALPVLPDQQGIVAYLDDLRVNVDRLKCLQEQTAAELDALLPSILDKAFKGEL